MADPASWDTLVLNNPIEVIDYKENMVFEEEIELPEEGYVQVLIDFIDTEKNYDVLTIKNEQGIVVEKFSGVGSNILTIVS